MNSSWPPHPMLATPEHEASWLALLGRVSKVGHMRARLALHSHQKGELFNFYSSEEARNEQKAQQEAKQHNHLTMQARRARTLLVFAICRPR